MSIKLIIDSASDISPDEANELGLELMPLLISFDDMDYKDGKTISKTEFYRQLKAHDQLPKTSQVTPYEYDQVISDVVSKGDTAIIITLASTLSGTCSSAQIAASNYPDDKVFVVDSMNVSVGERILIMHALDLIKQGLEAAEIVDILNEKKKQIKLLFLVNSLDSLYKGGRLSRLETMAGSFLSVKPILALEEGKIVIAGKGRGTKKSCHTHVELAKKYGEIDFSMPIYMAYSGDDESIVYNNSNAYEELFQKPIEEIGLTIIGSTVGTHAGVGAIAVGFFAKN
ncbi:DegV family protein [Peptostreptococcus anaerobius]|uniref:EDD domain protein, DegV family n=2 Tax=Peptostreptococcus anaerobius TaxID=1261 RepID=D3MTN0_9FIRM|nr:DegV family protein [Peptostreptococcus anaerobius]EFD04517.1 EDD domain protein, DegV family [Peptostreptococcus anaerobius 653-L]MDU1598904.1 DegV family protein [Peptostreptococcus anaerobius]MDU1682553.1 DegV family protein [Peptostreptococcus anaerobius]SFN00707.1 EDD domain protein, DegV family [Peptostreptococcus anaerobius]SUB61098.1 EDD domain protein, DegV family [Peptostreptococcus anaerobius]